MYQRIMAPIGSNYAEIGRLLGGSIAEQLIRKAEVPLLLVRS